MNGRNLVWAFLALLLFSVHASAAEKISKETLDSHGRKRTYYIFVPGSAAATPVPLVVLLHGSGRNGLSLAEKWKDLASAEGFIIVGPDASDPQGWRTPEDGPDFIHDLVETLRAKYPVNPRRIYLFGHSAGAVFAINLSMMESEYFAAAADAQPGSNLIPDSARRPRPASDTTRREFMIKGSERREADHPVDKLFLDRWSPRAMSGEEIAEEELMALFEAARWAPSSYNNQPWRILYARRGTEHWPLFLGLLVEGNQAWAKDAAALLLFVSKTTFDFNGETYPTHSFDTGAAWENLALQATLKGYVAHGMQGFDYERARTELNVPEGFRVEAMAAVGKPGRAEDLPESLQRREAPSPRKKLAEVVCEGPFRFRESPVRK